MSTNFKHVDKRVYEIAAMLDSMLRVSAGATPVTDELERDYLKNWLNKEKDPLVGTIVAQFVGLREINRDGEEDGSNE